jgi:hypothetical protein
MHTNRWPKAWSVAIVLACALTDTSVRAEPGPTLFYINPEAETCALVFSGDENFTAEPRDRAYRLLCDEKALEPDRCRRAMDALMETGAFRRWKKLGVEIPGGGQRESSLNCPERLAELACSGFLAIEEEAGPVCEALGWTLVEKIPLKIVQHPEEPPGTARLLLRTLERFLAVLIYNQWFVPVAILLLALITVAAIIAVKTRRARWPPSDPGNESGNNEPD